MSLGDFPAGLAYSLAGTWTVIQSSTDSEPCIIEMDWTEGLPEQFFIESPKEEDLLLLLYPPSINGGCSLNPLGAFIPSYEKSGEINLKDGAAVSILMTLRQNHLDIIDFNSRRFLSEMAELDDPWLVEEQTLLRQLGRREMRSWYIRTKTLFDIDISLPEGTWFGPSLLQPPLESKEPDSVCLKLPEGYSFLYCPERRELVEIQVDSHGDAVWIIESLPPAASTR